jgi:hypothetical protein
MAEHVLEMLCMDLPEIFGEGGRKGGGRYFESNQRDATIQVNLSFLVSSTCFGRGFHPSPAVAINPRHQPGSNLDEHYQKL